MKFVFSCALGFVLLAFSSRICAAEIPGCDLTKLAAVHERMEGFVEDHTISGAVTLIASHERILSVDTVGLADLSSKEPMRPNTLFWIASMTKPITAVAVLMLQDRGKINVENPVEQYLPEFKNQWLIEEVATNKLRLVRPIRPITIRDLLTHTSGMGDPHPPRFNSSLAEAVTFYSQQPLRFQPGTKWEYSTAGIDVLGRIVEVVSGLAFSDFLEHHIFHPLGMKETTFWPTRSETKRLAKSYKPSSDGSLEETDIYFIENGKLSDRRRTPRPGGGLFSTAADMARFYQMMLSGGTVKGKQLLSPTALKLLTHTQTGDIRTGFTEGMSWGLGFQVVKQPHGVTAMLSPGTFGHGGAYATQSWADPSKDLILILMIQRAGFPNGDESPVRKAFQEAAVAALGR